MPIKIAFHSSSIKKVSSQNYSLTISDVNGEKNKCFKRKYQCTHTYKIQFFELLMKEVYFKNYFFKYL